MSLTVGELAVPPLQIELYGGLVPKVIVSRAIVGRAIVGRVIEL